MSAIIPLGRRRKLTGRVIGAIIFMIFANIAFAMLGGYNYLELYQAHQAKAWPTAPGTVTESSSVYHPGRGCNYGLNFNYEYAVDGHPYTGDTYMVGGAGCEGDEAKRIASENPVGAKITVYYSPDDPANSVVAAGEFSSNGRIFIWFMPIMFFASLLGLFVLIRSVTHRYTPEEVQRIRARFEKMKAIYPPDSKAMQNMERDLRQMEGQD